MRYGSKALVRRYISTNMGIPYDDITDYESVLVVPAEKLSAVRFKYNGTWYALKIDEKTNPATISEVS